MGLSLLGYRPWTGGTLRGAWRSPWPIARIALRMVFRRKLFWVLYVLALLNFMIFFSGIYLLAQVDLLLEQEEVAGQLQKLPLGGKGIFPVVERLANSLKRGLGLTGDAATYRNFFWYPGYIVMAPLALAGSVVIGNDYQHGSLPFYLSKPLGRWHYLAGKFLALALFITMMTTLPALALYLEFGLLGDWSYLRENLNLVWGILGYGAAVTVVLSLLVLATASWLRKTVPMVLVWVGLLFFCRVLSRLLVDRLRLDPSWRLIDIWNSLYIVGSKCLGTAAELSSRRNRPQPPQPEWWEAALVLGAIVVTCLIYLNRRIRAVEIVR